MNAYRVYFVFLFLLGKLDVSLGVRQKDYVRGFHNISRSKPDGNVSTSRIMHLLKLNLDLTLTLDPTLDNANVSLHTEREKTQESTSLFGLLFSWLFNEEPRHRRIKRSKRYEWATFKNPRFKGYKYGFPRKRGRGAACSEQYFYEPGFNSERLADFFHRVYLLCIKRKGGMNCLWDHMQRLHDLTVQTVRNMGSSFALQTNWEEMSLCYIYLQCEGKKGQLPFCPVPCKKEPCKGKPHVSGDSCTQLDYGLFSDDYICQCQNHYDWDKNTMTCRRINICKDRSTNPCDPENTELCKLTTGDSGWECHCKPEFMGVTCKKLRNACIQNYDSQRPGGSETCGVHGNCRPILGANIYSCTCEAGWTDDPKNDWPDCQLKEDKCAHIICTNGFCRASESGNKAVCQCDAGFGGPDCREELPQWNPWAPWSGCDPPCGTPRKRKRQRTCNVLDGPCQGDREEFQGCSAKICLVAGAWADWESWSDCSVSCEGGERVRTRECFYNTPLGEEAWGTPCPGPASQLLECNIIPCPLDVAPRRVGRNAVELAKTAEQRANTRADGWKPWGAWSPCSVDCGAGEKTRTRDCGLSGTKCPGRSYQLADCTVPCDKYPYGPWSSWSLCTDDQTTCTRSRTCQMGPDNCQGSSSETVNCVNNLCNGTDSMTVSAVEASAGEHDAGLFAKTKGLGGVDGGGFRQTNAQADLDIQEKQELDNQRASEERELKKSLDQSRGHSDTEVPPESSPIVRKRIPEIVIGVVIAILAVIGMLFYCGKREKARDDVKKDKQPKRARGGSDVTERLLGDQDAPSGVKQGGPNLSTPKPSLHRPSYLPSKPRLQ